MHFQMYQVYIYISSFSSILSYLFQKYSLYWHYAVLIFTSKLHDRPQQYNPPHLNKMFCPPPPPSKDFSVTFNLPPSWRGCGGVHALGVLIDLTPHPSKCAAIRVKFFANFPVKHLCWSLFFNKVVGLTLKLL